MTIRVNPSLKEGKKPRWSESDLDIFVGCLQEQVAALPVGSEIRINWSAAFKGMLSKLPKERVDEFPYYYFASPGNVAHQLKIRFFKEVDKAIALGVDTPTVIRWRGIAPAVLVDEDEKKK